MIKFIKRLGDIFCVCFAVLMMPIVLVTLLISLCIGRDGTPDKAD
jgi:hypothetical protein